MGGWGCRKGEDARSIFDWNLVSGALGIRLGCGRCYRRSSIAWRRRSAIVAQFGALRIRGLVCNIAALVTYSSQVVVRRVKMKGASGNYNVRARVGLNTRVER